MMDKDPYRILGVERGATEEQIKTAYRDLARRYHPDNYTDPAKAAKAEEQMKEINEAYDRIRHGDKQSFSSSAGGGGAYAAQLSLVRQHLRAGNIDGADRLLESIPQEERAAEWYFLKGCVLTQKGWYFDAQKHLETACYMDPENREYREFLSGIRSAAAGYGGGRGTDARGGQSDICDICATLACMDCMCECCGTDLFRCC